MILGEIFERNAALFGDQTAIYFNDHAVTHATLLARAYQLGNALLSLGLRRQDRVAILAQNCIETLELIAAAGLTGLTCVGLNYRLSTREQVHILQDSVPSVWLFEAQYAERVQEICASLTTLPALLCIGTPTPTLTNAYKDYGQLVSQAASTRPALIAREQDTIFLVYTSGTTGQPKGVMHSQRGQRPEAQELIEHCRQQIASYKKPKSILFIEALPRIASTNKVDKKNLRARMLHAAAQH